MRALTDGKTKIGAQLFPDRKRPAICVQKGNKIKIYGYFQNVEAAQEFIAARNILAEGLRSLE